MKKTNQMVTALRGPERHPVRFLFHVRWTVHRVLRIVLSWSKNAEFDPNHSDMFLEHQY